MSVKENLLAVRTQVSGLIYYFHALLEYIQAENNGELPDNEEVQAAKAFLEANEDKIQNIARGSNE